MSSARPEIAVPCTTTPGAPVAAVAATATTIPAVVSAKRSPTRLRRNASRSAPCSTVYSRTARFVSPASVIPPRMKTIDATVV